VRIRVLSLGAGVQSTTLALMAAEGILAKPDAAVADTGWEPGRVYEHLGNSTRSSKVWVSRCSSCRLAARRAGAVPGSHREMRDGPDGCSVARSAQLPHDHVGEVR